MADWKKLAKALALADGKIDTREAKIIKDEIWADGKLDKSELEFLLDLKKSAKSVVGDFNKMLFAAVKAAVLADGDISAKEAAWLRQFLYADGEHWQCQQQFPSHSGSLVDGEGEEQLAG